MMLLCCPRAISAPAEKRGVVFSGVLGGVFAAQKHQKQMWYTMCRFNNHNKKDKNNDTNHQQQLRPTTGKP